MLALVALRMSVAETYQDEVAGTLILPVSLSAARSAGVLALVGLCKGGEASKGDEQEFLEAGHNDGAGW